SRLLVVFFGLAVQRGGLAMDTGDRGIGVFGDQPLAALGGGAFAGRLLARALAEPASPTSPTSPLSMLLAAHTGHGNTVPPVDTPAQRSRQSIFARTLDAVDCTACVRRWRATSAESCSDRRLRQRLRCPADFVRRRT